MPVAQQRVPHRDGDAVLEADVRAHGVDEPIHPRDALGVRPGQAGQAQHGTLNRDGGGRAGHADHGLGRVRCKAACLGDDRGVEMQLRLDRARGRHQSPRPKTIGPYRHTTANPPVDRPVPRNACRCAATVAPSSAPGQQSARRRPPSRPRVSACAATATRRSARPPGATGCPHSTAWMAAPATTVRRHDGSRRPSGVRSGSPGTPERGSVDHAETRSSGACTTRSPLSHTA